jgi:hypothetical protein
VDPTGHWTEEQLAALLGDDWRDEYFGAGAVFEGRDRLLEFLLSDSMTSDVVLELMHPFFTISRAAGEAGISLENIDALGGRFTASGGELGFFSGSIDVILNLTAGEFSVFLTGEGGILLGVGTSLVGGVTLLKGLPSNDDFRGTCEAVGLIGGDVAMINAEWFWSAPMSDSYRPSDRAHGGFVGVGAGQGIGVYGSLSYAWEVYRADVLGESWLPQPLRPLDVTRDLGSAIDHDIVSPLLYALGLR